MKKNSNIKSNKRIEDSEINSKNLLFNTVAILYIIGLLSIDFFSYFKSIQIIYPQYLFLSILNILITLFYIKYPGIITINFSELFKKNILFKLYLAFIFLCGISMFLANNLSVSIVFFTQIFIVFLVFINLTILLYNKSQLFYNLIFLVGIGAFLQSLIEINEFINVCKVDTLQKGLDELKGNTGNINVFAASLNIKIPFILLGIIHFSDWKKWFLTLTLFISSLCVYLTSARTAFIGLIFIFIVFVIYSIKNNITKKAIFKNITNVAIPILFSFLLSNLIFSEIKNNERYSSISTRFEKIKTEEKSGQIADASAQARINFWRNAFKISAKNPMFGVGIGNWFLASNAYEKELLDESTTSTHAHNDFLEIMAETGIINGLIYLSIFILLFYKSLKNSFFNNTKNYELYFLILMLVIIYGIDASFNFPLYRPTMQIGFCFILSLYIANDNTKSLLENTIIKNKLKLIYLLLILGITTTYVSYSSFKTSQLEQILRLDKGNGTYSVSANYILDNFPKFPNVNVYSESYYEYAGNYFFHEKNNAEAKKCFARAEKINPFLGKPDFYLQKVFNSENNIDSAYYHSKKAFYYRPLSNNYFTTAIFLASKKRDSIEILKMHKFHHKFVKKSDNYVNTAKALGIMKYNSKKLTAFIDEGMLEFPKDSALTSLKNIVLDGNLNKMNLYNVDLSENKQNEQLKLIEKAQYYSINKQYDKAIIYFKQASILDPNYTTLVQNIGACHYELKQYNEAIPYLLKTIASKNINDGLAELILGICYLNTQNLQKGCEYLNIAKSKKNPKAQALIDQYCK